jgi:hypothetical protein
MLLPPYPAYPMPGALSTHVDLEHVQTISKDILFADDNDMGMVLHDNDDLKMTHLSARYHRSRPPTIIPFAVRLAS